MFQRVVGKNQLPTPMQVENRQIDLTAMGTSAGVKKAWDKRGRGRKRILQRREFVSMHGHKHPRAANAYKAEHKAWMKRWMAGKMRSGNIKTGKIVPRESPAWANAIAHSMAFKKAYAKIAQRKYPNITLRGAALLYAAAVQRHEAKFGRIPEQVLPKFIEGFVSELPQHVAGLQAYGTSAGVRRAWDVRGRGRKAKPTLKSRTSSQYQGVLNNFKNTISYLKQRVTEATNAGADASYHKSLYQSWTKQFKVLQSHVHGLHRAQQQFSRAKTPRGRKFAQTALTYHSGQLKNFYPAFKD